MFIDSKKAEEQAILNVAYAICAAARTAPKTRGIDHTNTAILTGEDKMKIADEMRRMGEAFSSPFLSRDAKNIEACAAVVLIGTKCAPRGLNELCGICGFVNCAACTEAGAQCVFTGMDLGIALGSAAALAADNRIDNRMMFTIGKAAAALGLMGEYNLIIGIPLSVSGKSPFFDRG